MTVFVTNELAGLLAGPVAAVARRAGLPWAEGARVPLGACREERHGELSSPAALRIAARLRSRAGSPRRIGEAILGALPAAESLLERAEVAGPGYLNFTVRPGRWLDDLAAIVAGAALPGGPDQDGFPSGGGAAVAGALGRIEGIFRARAAAGAPDRPAAADLSLLTLPQERALARRVALLPPAAEPSDGAPGLREHLEGLAAAFRDYDAGVRLVGGDADLTRARLALVAAVGRALRAGLGRLAAR